MITVLAGANRLLIDKELAKLSDDFVKKHDELAVERFDGEEASYEQLLGAVSTLPFLAEKKLVIVKRLGANKTVADRLDALIENRNDDVDLVLVEDKLDKRSQYYKLLKALPGFQEFKDADERNLVDWLVNEAKGQGGTLSRADATELVNRVGASQQRIGSELVKLLLYNPDITRTSIELLTDMTPRSSVFNLLDKAFAGDTKSAVRLYDEQRQQNVEPFNILALVIWQLHALALAKTAGDMSSAEFTKQSGLSPYTASKAYNLARSRSLSDIADMINRAVGLEYKSKTSSVDIDEALKNFIASL